MPHPCCKSVRTGWESVANVWERDYKCRCQSYRCSQENGLHNISLRTILLTEKSVFVSFISTNKQSHKKMTISELLDWARPFTWRDAHSHINKFQRYCTHTEQQTKSRFPQANAALIHHRSRKINDHHRTPIILPVILCKTTLLSLRDVTVEAKAETKSILLTTSSVNSQV